MLNVICVGGDNTLPTKYNQSNLIPAILFLLRLQGIQSHTLADFLSLQITTLIGCPGLGVGDNPPLFLAVTC